jgi:DNA-binding NarL/FixJ family response regulator
MTANNPRTMVLELLEAGLNEVQIAGDIGVIPKTIENLRDGVTKRMHLNNRLRLEELYAAKVEANRKVAAV